MTVRQKVALGLGVGFYLGLWVQNYRWIQATNKMFDLLGVEMSDEAAAYLGHDGGCDCDEE